jgi:MauM/NapG family ferredoxin protein
VSPKKVSWSRWRPLIQLLSLGAFLFFLLSRAVWPAGESLWPPDLYLRLDPLAALGAPLAARDWIGRLLPGLILIAASLFVGRIFCGYLCPFGATLDLWSAVRRRLSGPSPARLKAAWRRPKYLLLIVVLGAALLGVNLLYWAAPIPLITRFYALILHPLFSSLGGFILTQGGGLLEALGLSALTYSNFSPRGFDSLFFLIFFFGIVLVLEWRWPRFWCRVLCPAGALLALASSRPLWRRRVAGCLACGRCVRACPTAAISADGRGCQSGECLACQSCVDICPVSAVSFRPGKKENRPEAEKGGEETGPFRPVSRRAFLGSAALGLALGGFHRRGPALLMGAGQAGTLVRPPGSLPEAEFLVRCLRCGECLKACPSNALAASSLGSGLASLFSPYLLARRGPCQPECRRCGQLCPSQAILSLPLEEKRWAKMGTAVVLRETCLAWAENRRCVVCQEVCPYGALDLVQEAGREAPTPVVRAERCYGCGYCEHHCPVPRPAIVIGPEGALRLASPDYRREALARALDLDPESRAREADLPEGGLPPGFLDLD